MDQAILSLTLLCDYAGNCADADDDVDGDDVKDCKFVPFMFVTLGFGSQIPLLRAIFHGLGAQNPRVQALRVQRKAPDDDDDDDDVDDDDGDENGNDGIDDGFLY